MKKKIMILSILIILSILLIIAIFLDKNKYIPNQEEINKVSISSVKKEIINNEEKKDDAKNSFEEKYFWQLSIPKIGLNTPIKEGSDNNTLKSFVGHIEGTGTNGSNICLAGHKNTANYKGIFYFNDLDKLEIGDFIIYKNRNNIFKFKVTDKFETDENNVSILNESINTKITLITCITGKHSKRLIVVGEKVD